MKKGAIVHRLLVEENEGFVGGHRGDLRVIGQDQI